MMIFNRMREDVQPIMTKIFQQKFNHQLSQGILVKEKFIYYLQQDALYLADYSRALALTGARLSCNHQATQFIQFALGAIKAEQALQMDYLQKHTLSPMPEQNRACFMYVNYLLRMASLASAEEAVASLLPCFWVYREVGFTMLPVSADHPYRDWIELYAGEEFNQSVEAAIAILNQLGKNASAELQEKMMNAFNIATQLEWHFWEEAFETNPVTLVPRSSYRMMAV